MRDEIVIITSMSDECGTCWQVTDTFDGSIIEDGFDSFMDANNWAIEEGFKFSTSNQ